MVFNPVDITEVERPLRSSQPVRPRVEIWHLMRKHVKDLKAVREDKSKQAGDEGERLRNLLKCVADPCHQLNRFVNDQSPAVKQAGLSQQATMLAAIRDGYDKALGEVGAKLIYLDGKPWSPDVARKADIVDSVPTEGVDWPTVKHTVSPGVELDGEVVVRAKVILSIQLANNPDQRSGGGFA